MDNQTLLAQWANQIKDMKSRRAKACQDRDAAIVQIDTLNREIDQAQFAFDRAAEQAERASG